MVAIVEQHVTQCRRIDLRRKTPVHSAMAHLLTNPDRSAILADPYVTDEVFDRLPLEPYLLTPCAIKAAPAAQRLVDGDVIHLGVRRFEVRHTPGLFPAKAARGSVRSSGTG